MKSECSHLRPHFRSFLLNFINHVVKVVLVLFTKRFEKLVHLHFSVHFNLEPQGFKFFLFLLFFQKSVVVFCNRLAGCCRLDSVELDLVFRFSG